MIKTKKAAAILSIIVLCVVTGIVLAKINDQQSVSDAVTDGKSDIATNNMTDYDITIATTDATSNIVDSKILLHENTYYDVISGLIDKYGIAISEDGFISDKGVFYAGFFNFNNNVKNELLVFYYDDNLFGYEIWTNDGDKIEKLYSNIYECCTLRQHYEIFVTTIEERSYIIEVEDAYALAGIDGGNFCTIYTVEKDQWVQKERLEYTYLYKDGMEDDPVFMEVSKNKESGEYYRIIKGNESKKLTKEQYDQVLEKYYNKSCISVINAGWGEPVKYGITIDITDNNKQLVDLIKILSGVRNDKEAK